MQWDQSSHEQDTMNRHLRNFPKPPLAVVYADCGLGQRREIVAQICDRTNEVTEFVLGYNALKVLVPAQSNIDERMPLTFLRPCVAAINDMITDQDLPIALLTMPTNNMDYHRFVPMTREIAEALNAIIELL
jgi:hypothetical protein